MGDRDKAVLKAAGLSIPRAAGMLQITRQALHERVTGSATTEYLDQSKLARIYLALCHSEQPGDADRALLFAHAVRQQYQTNLEEIVDAKDTDAVFDYYCIFTPRPYELEDPAFVRYMVKDIFTKATVVAYFMGYESAIQTFIEELDLQRKQVERPWPAKQYVIRSNLVDAIPHIAITRNRKGEWEGHVFSLKKPHLNPEVLDSVYTARLIRILRHARFAIESEDDPSKFFPTDKKKLSYRGLEFENLTPKEWNPSK